MKRFLNGSLFLAFSIGALILFTTFCYWWMEGFYFLENQVQEAKASVVERVATYGGFVRPEAIPTPPAPPDELDIAEMLQRESLRRSRNPALCKAVGWVESKWRATAVSIDGALGVMQVMPFNAEHCDLSERAELFDVEKNIACGCQLLDEFIDAEGGDVIRGLQRYNGGGRCVAVIEKCPPNNLICMGWKSKDERGCAESFFFARDVLAYAMSDVS